MRIHNVGLFLGTILMVFVLLRGTEPFAFDAIHREGQTPKMRLSGLLMTGPVHALHRAGARAGLWAAPLGDTGRLHDADTDSAQFAISDTLAGYPSEAGQTGAPSSVLMMDPVPDCNLLRPQPGEILADLRVGTGGDPAPLGTLDEADLIGGALDWLRRAKRPEADRRLPDLFPALHQLHRVDVALTEAARPLHLILQSLKGGVLWNLHVAPGTTIARITVVGAAPSGLVDPDPGIPVQFVAPAPFDQGCLPNLPWGRVGPPERAVPHPLLGNARYEEWFTRVFAPASAGVELHRLHRDRAALIRLGPVPVAADGRAPYRGIAGRPVLLSRSDHAFAYGPDENRAAGLALQARLLAKAAGGDPSAIWPAPQDRAQ